VFKRKLLIFSIIFLFIFSGAAFYILEEEWVDFSVLSQLKSHNSSMILDDEGKVLAYFENERREYVPFNKLPKILVNAFIAAEDHSFFDHNGISFRGILRSVWVNLKSGRRLQGASTITQQVARLLFLNSEKTFLRKFREIFLSVQLEKQLTKQQIFELYANNIYFGRGIYGVEAACKRFWNKSVNQIDIAQAATLASVAKSAQFYSPLNDLEKSKKRRNLILQSMNSLGMISQKEFESSCNEPLAIHGSMIGGPMRLYVQEWVRIWAENKWGKDFLENKGIKIYTTLNRQTQEAAEKSFAEIIQQWRGSLGNNLNGGLVAVEPSSGRIKAFVGGLSFSESQYNRAFQATRQMGSSFKPLIYAAALQRGLSMKTVFVDEPISIEMPNGDNYEPRNWTHRFDGAMTLLKALTISDNIVAVKTLLEVGYNPVIELAKSCGLNKQLLPYPSLALGICESTVLENVAAFNIFANNGVYVEPYFIESVKDARGKVLWQSSDAPKHRVLDSKINSKMMHALSWRMRRAKTLYGNWIDAESIGKTGSTNDSTTNWFVGATPELTTAIYVGRDDAVGMGKDVFGSQTSFPIWLNFYRRLQFKEKSFYVDPDLHEVAINWTTGQNASDMQDPDTATILE